MASKVTSNRWRDWVMLVLAAWLFVSPWLLGYTSPAPAGGEAVTSGFATAAWNAWVLGVIVAVFAIWAIYSFAEWHDWVNGVLGVWLVVSPWILGFSAMTAAVWNHVIVGLLIVALAAWELWEVRHESRATA